MLCEQCRMREASIVIREVVNGTVTERNLCSECASQSDFGGLLMDSGSPFAKLLSGILGISDSRRSEEEDASNLSCPTCGMTYKEFVQDGRFGCADCYNTFGLLINNSIKKIQGNNSHTGKKPRFSGDKKIHADMVADAKKRQSLNEQLEVCQAKQKEAVSEEDYEKAAYYRDEIKKIKERIQAGDEVV